MAPKAAKGPPCLGWALLNLVSMSANLFDLVSIEATGNLAALEAGGISPCRLWVLPSLVFFVAMPPNLVPQLATDNLLALGAGGVSPCRLNMPSKSVWFALIKLETVGG